MKKLTALLAVVAVIGFYYFRRPVAPNSPSAAPSKPAPKLKAKELSGRAPRDLKLPAATDMAQIFSAQCASVGQLAEASFDELKTNLSKLDEYVSTDCLSKNPGIKAELGEKIAKACDKFYKHQAPTADDREINECLAQLALYRAVVIDRLSREQKNPSATVLMNKIIARFVDGLPKDAAALADLKKLASDLEGLEPNLYAAKKAVVVADTMEYLSQVNPTSAETLEAFKKAIDNARTLNPNDPDLLDASVAPYVMKGDFQRVQEMALQFSQDNPSSARGPYYLGCVAWHKRDEVGARFQFKAALQVSPKDVRSLDAMKKIDAGAKPGEAGVCILNLGVNFDDV